MVRATKTRNAISIEDEVERLARTFADAVAQARMPRAVFRGYVPSRYGPIERWGSGGFEVWCIRTGFDLRHRRFYKEQWQGFELGNRMRELRYGPLYDQVRERALDLLARRAERRPGRTG